MTGAGWCPGVSCVEMPDGRAMTVADAGAVVHAPTLRDRSNGSAGRRPREPDRLVRVI
jgi:hypothetical protein